MKARIYQPAKTAMQSGRANTRHWVVTFEETAAKFVDPLMGWVGQQDTQQQLSLTFESCDQAVAYCKQHGYNYRILPLKARKIVPKSYADNFAFHKLGS